MARLQPDAKKKPDMLQSFINAGLTEEELKQEIWVETLAHFLSLSSPCSLYTASFLSLFHTSFLS
jgi:hypothetical protein